MLYFPPGVEFKRVHGAFVGDDEVHRVVSDMKSKAEPNYVEIISSKQETGPITGWTTVKLHRMKNKMSFMMKLLIL